MGGRHTDRIGTFRDWLRDAMTGDLDGPRPVGDASKPHSQAVQRLLIKQLCAVITRIVRARDGRLRDLAQYKSTKVGKKVITY